MDKCFVLIVADRGSEILGNPYTKSFQSLVQSFLGSNCVIYLVLPTYDLVRKFRDQFTPVNCILLDVDKNLETDKEILTSLPEFDCVLDFTGKLGTKILCWVPEIEFKKKESWKLKNASVTKISEFLNGREEVTPALITFLPTVQEANPVTKLTKVLKKKGTEAVKEAFCPPKSGPINFHPSLKYNRNPADNGDGGRAGTSIRTIRGATTTNTEEREPLLADGDSSPPSDTFIDAFSQFISWTWSTCCCCLSSWDPELSSLPEFRSSAHLQAYVRAEHDKYIRSKLTFQDADATWLRILRSIQAEEDAEAESIRADYDDKEQEQMNKYRDVVAKNKEASPTQKILVTAAASREQAEAKKLKLVKHDLARDLEGLKIKYKNLRDTQAEERLYEELVTKQGGILRRARQKYAQFGSDLYEQHGSNWA